MATVGKGRPTQPLQLVHGEADTGKQRTFGRYTGITAVHSASVLWASRRPGGFWGMHRCEANKRLPESHFAARWWRNGGRKTLQSCRTGCIAGLYIEKTGRHTFFGPDMNVAAPATTATMGEDNTVCTFSWTPN